MRDTNIQYEEVRLWPHKEVLPAYGFTHGGQKLPPPTVSLPLTPRLYITFAQILLNVRSIQRRKSSIFVNSFKSDASDDSD